MEIKYGLLCFCIPELLPGTRIMWSFALTLCPCSGARKVITLPQAVRCGDDYFWCFDHNIVITEE